MSRANKFKSLPRHQTKDFEFLEEEDTTSSTKPRRPKRKRRAKSCRPFSNYNHLAIDLPAKGKTVKPKVQVEGRVLMPTSRNASYVKLMENMKNVPNLFEHSNKLESSCSWMDLSESNSTKSSTDVNNVNTSDVCLDVAESLEKESLKHDSDEDRILSKQLMKDANVIVIDMKKTIEGLQLRLTETIKQNTELKMEMNCLRKQMSVIKEDEDSDENNKNMTEMDVEKLREIQDENAKRLEDSLDNRLELMMEKFQKQIDELANSYETKLQSVRVDKEVNLKDKDQEIARLNDIIEKQCLRMSNEITSLRAQMVECVNSNSSDEKVLFLQKCVAKMDRLFHKAERDYQRQIEKLKNTLEQKDKSMLILLKSQRVEVMSKACAEKQSQFDHLVNNLEYKYVKMLEHQSQQYSETLQKQESVIDYLRRLLDKHSIAYDLHSLID